MTIIVVAFSLGVAITALAAMNAGPAAAEVYRPWCVDYPRDGSTSCVFTSYEQCMLTAGPGTGGECVQNPWYLYGGGPKGQAQGGTGRQQSGRR